MSSGSIVQGEWMTHIGSHRGPIFLSGNQGIWCENQMEFNAV